MLWPVLCMTELRKVLIRSSTWTNLPPPFTAHGTISLMFQPGRSDFQEPLNIDRNSSTDQGGVRR